VAWVTPTIPNLADYGTWLFTVVGPVAGLTQKILPPASQVIQDTLFTAESIVTTALQAAGPWPQPPAPPPPSLTIYVQAVYNLGTDRLYNWAGDVGGQTYFADKRKEWGLWTMSVGVASQASDQGTAVGLLNPEQMQLLTLQDLQTLKTPWGRAYMAYAQMYGRNLWGLT
jgi:hypothetical protein